MVGLEGLIVSVWSIRGLIVVYVKSKMNILK